MLGNTAGIDSDDKSKRRWAEDRQEEEAIFAKATKDGRIAGDDGEHDDDQLERAKALLIKSPDEKILAIYEPGCIQGCKARWQPIGNACIFPPCAIYWGGPCFPCYWTMREAAAFDRSLWVVTDRHIHKQVQDGCRADACSQGGCCYSCFSCAEPLKGSDSGKIALDQIVDVDTYGDNFADSCCGIVLPGSLCCATDYVAVQVPRGHLLAHEGYKQGGKGRIRKLHNVFIILVDDAIEAKAIIRTAIRARPKPQKMKREKQDGKPVYDKEWSDLTDDQRKAAEFLGYTNKKWSNDTRLPVEDKDWDELTEAQQEAAATLGYTEESWDEDD